MFLEVVKKAKRKIKINIKLMYMISKKHLKGLIFNFIVGGALIAGSGLIADIYSSRISGMFYSSIPAGLIYLYIYIQLNQNKKESKNYALFSIIGGIVWVLMAVMLWVFNEKHLLVNLLITMISYVILVIFAYKVTEKVNSKLLKN